MSTTKQIAHHYVFSRYRKENIQLPLLHNFDLSKKKKNPQKEFKPRAGIRELRIHST